MNSKPQAVADATGVCLAFTKLTNTRGLLTKQYSLDGAGRLQKTTNATLATGRAETVHCAGLAEFMAYRATLAPSEALTYGVPASTAPRSPHKRNFARVQPRSHASASLSTSHARPGC